MILCRVCRVLRVRSPVRALGTAALSHNFSKIYPQGKNPDGISSQNKMAVSFSLLEDEPGALRRTLDYFWKEDINLTSIHSSPSKKDPRLVDLKIDFAGDHSSPMIQTLLRYLERETSNFQVIGTTKVPWFPQSIEEVDLLARNILDAGSDLQADHPGFQDQDYRERRRIVAEKCDEFSIGSPIPRIKYSEDEVACWSSIWKKLYPLLKMHACREHLETLSLMEDACGFKEDNIPQLQDISSFISSRTNFRLRPVKGLLSARDFLNGLAFRVFFCTQYLRHHSRPLYTPEPDIVHELLGHAPLFANPDFAAFSQEIGLASIGATDEQIQQLSRCYWYSVEFGLCLQETELKAYGAGILSSFGELSYSMGCNPADPSISPWTIVTKDGSTYDSLEADLSMDKHRLQELNPDKLPPFRANTRLKAAPDIRPWDPFEAAKHDYPITHYQPVYYCADSFTDAKQRMVAFSESLMKPFNVRFNPITSTLDVDRAVRVDKAAET